MRNLEGIGLKEIQKEAAETAGRYGQEFHCSESVFRAINDVFELNLSDEFLRLSTGFRGGGGGYGDRCGTIEAGIMAISHLYGRVNSDEDCNAASYLIRIMHDRFQDELGSIYCRILLPFHKKISENNDCLYVYRKGAEIVAGVIYEAEDLLENMPEEEKDCS